MGGGTAALLTGLMREKVPGFEGARCWAIACPACMTLELARGCGEYVTTVVNGCDIVPTFCSGTIDSLREEVRGQGGMVAAVGAAMAMMQQQGGRGRSWRGFAALPA